ncbi:zinc ribbon domain-containing protein [Sedimenticola sp.]|uniref:zinc ribbon domain-containing protein n=1 Tax=Sedimenticola sp. TaxID=1940285 RepID=UPI003D0C88EF
MKFCHSCAAPLENPQFKGPSESYCVYCTDDQGTLKPRQAVKEGVAGWFLEWQPGIDPQAAQARAEHYLLAMPAWAE